MEGDKKEDQACKNRIKIQLVVRFYSKGIHLIYLGKSFFDERNDANRFTESCELFDWWDSHVGPTNQTVHIIW